ncbi:MAG: YitT family protein [Bacteroidales bacterium]|nr:YitT family protein [Bacteroidales bacterium]
MKNNKLANEIRSYLMIAVGLFINALGVTAFLIPAKIVGGGVSGIGLIIFFAKGIPVGYSVLVINAFLVILAIKILGAKFGIKTIYSIIVVSVFLTILQKFITTAVVSDQFMSALIGGAMAGVGIGIAIANGGNSGGTDIIALIINKYRNISPGRIILYFDVVIIASSFFLFHSLEKIVYGYVVMGVLSYSLDLVLTGSRQSYQIMIFSKKHELIADRIGHEIGRGITSLHGKGWYNKQDFEVLIVISRKGDRQKIMKIIKETDENAFISVAKVMGVFGQNFDKIKI